MPANIYASGRNRTPDTTTHAVKGVDMMIMKDKNHDQGLMKLCSQCVLYCLHAFI